MTLTENQLSRLQSLGISLPAKTARHPSVLLAGLSGLTLLSFGGLVLLKNQTSSDLPSLPNSPDIPSPIPSPTPGLPADRQVPKSIQHYLLASQQSFSQALQLQNVRVDPRPPAVEGGDPSISTSQSQIIKAINQSITTATQAIQNFPSDYRGFLQRAQIYQSLVDSQPQYLQPAIADLAKARQLNPDSPEITRSLALLYGKSGDTKNTLTYLAQTVLLEPTKAQNFYDLARLQQQIGLLPQALETYHRLLPLISDPSQKSQVESEQSALEKIISQHPDVKIDPSISPLPIRSPQDEGGLTNPSEPLLQAAGLPAKTVQPDGLSAGLIIAAPQTGQNIKVSSLTDSNALSGTGAIPASQSSVSITNSNLTSTSQVYLSITKGGKNQVLKLLSKSAGSFVAGFDQPQPVDTEFKWWIIN